MTDYQSILSDAEAKLLSLSSDAWHKTVNSETNTNRASYSLAVSETERRLLQNLTKQIRALADRAQALRLASL